MAKDVFSEFEEDLKRVLGIRTRALKHHLLGMEAEFMLLDSNGFVAHTADKILKAAGAAKKECARNMIEIAAPPSQTIEGTISNMLERVQSLLDSMEKEGYSLYCYGTYPGAFQPSMRDDEAYKIKEKIFGKERFKIAGRCAGLHCHYTLPRGVFDSISKHLKLFINSKLSQSFVSSYNMLIAMDPALSAFAQSSPYYQGKFYGKDSRIMFYRGSRIFGVDGLYTDFQDFGGLPHYKHTLIDVMHIVEDQFREWSALMQNIGVNAKVLALYGSVLDTNWSPVKINPLGTLEMRGMDMNRLEIAASLATIIKSVLKSVHENYISVIDRDIAIREPFKMEGDRIYIPPYSYVSNVLQLNSVLYGMESPMARLYCSKLLNLAAKTLPSGMKKFLKPLREMLKKKRTVSDEIMREAKRMDHKEILPKHAAAELALKLTENVQNDIDKTGKLFGL